MRRQIRLGLAFLAFAVMLACASLSYAITTAQQQLLWQSSSVHDGISLDFTKSLDACCYVKAPGAPAQRGSFQSLFTFTRNSMATFLGSDGLIQIANENQFQFSEDISNAFWTKNAATATANSTTAPDGTATADTLTADAGAGTLPRYADTSALTMQNVPAVASVYAKAGTYNFVQIYVNSQAADYANFNVSTCTVGTTGTGTATATPVGNGWCRISLSYIPGSTDRRPFFLISASASATRAQTWSPAGTETVFFWGSQWQWGRLGNYIAATAGAKKYDQPRIEYDTSGNMLGLLIEGARTNRALWSNDMTNAAWVAVTTTTAQTATGPDGNTNSATTLTATAGNGTMLQAFVEAAVDSTYCAWIKRRTGSGNIDMTEDTGATWTTMAVTSTWTKFCTAHQSFLNPNIGIRIVTNGDAVDVWGNQLEAGAFGSSTIPTTIVAVARAAEIVIRTFGAEVSQLTGTMFVEASSDGLTVQGEIFQINDGTTNNRHMVYHDSSATGRALTVTGGVNQAIPTDIPLVAGALTKLSYAYALNDFAFEMSGRAPVIDASGTLPTTTRVELGGSVSVEHIRRLDYWPIRQPNDFLQRKTLPGPMSALEPANDNAARKVA